MMPELMPLGDRALLVNFGSQINIRIHKQVLSLQSSIEHKKIDGITFLQPAYCSLTIGFDPLKLRYQELKPIVRKLSLEVSDLHEPQGKFITLPVCYEEPYALDLQEISNLTGLNKKEIVAIHTSSRYQVFMLGFLPGFSYLGVLPEILHLPRKQTPRLEIPERSVGVAGLQTGIYPARSPGGWNILGRTPVPVFNGLSEHPFLLSVGDQVKFQAIGIEQYQKIRQQIADNTYNWNLLYG